MIQIQACPGPSPHGPQRLCVSYCGHYSERVLGYDPDAKEALAIWQKLMRFLQKQGVQMAL